ncbi:hypothetical protein [Streptomyces alkaliterrae]|uniref:Sensor domain-containing protein n=1 Tax=Streptomyces alkaliterrae TaxID=2213162 RepID=A0A5P0YPW6_9ACTN|nr:hypothetical protein [Streptomyces alkaliterrae]MBB1254757.1 hypothetical protein [Streptomyces alkaliterrae]MBB1259251.1 hypothetical protein [Streptomyces alkaliterrae]MQS02393.1 hypothetical protein [Streptomyces alkaliterrae]
MTAVKTTPAARRGRGRRVRLAGTALLGLTAAALCLPQAAQAAAGATSAEGVATAKAAGAANATAAAWQPGAVSPRLPGLLKPNDLPPHPDGWFVTETGKGLQPHGELCVPDGTLPKAGAMYRTFQSGLDAGASQTVVKAKNATAAAKLVRELRTAVEGCPARFKKEVPDGKVRFRDLGDFGAGKDGRVYAMATETWVQDINVIGIGRKDDRVTIVRWGQMGRMKDVPQAEFKKTMRTAVNKLVR